MPGSEGNLQNQHSKKQGKHNPDTLEYILYAWVCSKGALWNFCQDSTAQTISRVLYGNDAVLCHVMFDSERNENDTDKYPNIIEDYEIAKKLFTAEYVLIWEKDRENTVSQLFPSTRDKIQNKRNKSRE